MDQLSAGEDAGLAPFEVASCCSPLSRSAARSSMSGPTWVSGDMPSPTTRAETRPTSSSSTFGVTVECMTSRFVEMQDWPPLR